MVIKCVVPLINTVLHYTGEDMDLESGVLTEKLGTSLMNDFELLKLNTVCNSLLH